MNDNQNICDRGYISHELKNNLKEQCIDLNSYHRKNILYISLSTEDGYHLKQRNKLEILFSLLKVTCKLVTNKAHNVLQAIWQEFILLCVYQFFIKISQSFVL